MRASGARGGRRQAPGRRTRRGAAIAGHRTGGPTRRAPTRARGAPGAQIKHAQDRGSDAAALLLVAGERFKALDVALSREIYLQGLSAATFVGQRSQGGGVRDIAQAALAAPPSPDPPRACDLLLDGLTTRFTVGYSAAAPTVKRALRAFPGEAACNEEESRWLWLACRAAVDLWDDQAWEALVVRHLQLAREAGALTVLPLALSQRISALTYCGRACRAPVADRRNAGGHGGDRERSRRRTAPCARRVARPRAGGVQLIEAIRSEVVPAARASASPSPLGERGALQRPRPLRGRAPRPSRPASTPRTSAFSTGPWSS